MSDDRSEFGLYVEFGDEDGTLNISLDEVPVDCLRHVFTTQIADAITTMSMDINLDGDDAE